MLESLTDRMTSALRNLRGVGKLSEENMADALKEVRTALLSADVHFKVARQFVEDVKAAATGQEVLKSVTPGQQIIKIINDELTKLLGEGSTALKDKKPLRIMMVGLHGAGKTTTSAKLAKRMAKNGYLPALIACDVYRPAAIDQLETLGQREEIPVYTDRDSKDVPKIGRQGLEWAKAQGRDLIIFDTAGRLQIDENLVQEIVKLKKEIQPDEILLVADSALGQEAVNVAQHFHDAVQLTGIVLTKLDGDARGGAALSMKAITNVPIKFMGTGEKIEEFDVFHPDRMAQRILGMGDVVSLVEKAQESIDQDEAQRLAEKMKKADFDLEDFLSQMRQIKKLGSLGGIMKMLPGAHGLEIGDEHEDQLKHTEAMILSMTPYERRNPQIINGSRRKRIAAGSGMDVRDLNQLLKQFGQMRKMMKSMKGSKGRKQMERMAKQMGGMPGMPGK
ncbi:signal recognition particle protein [Cerasicoccus arenae]|uniref:Signal recognition particle protein n=1 Tax=Cerasicoccus arenae TaxID=424488 RepID=A0A8J3DES1_9BACT|nr:signal recognition particle protein [Cerasicoccus arenae]MBK1857682.1 signal recognition particle protein [Cerasicoccus arenae]GHB91400.1 signal recognition particle protein [Cerasicoccus arenae]